jgi:hypothetical protein
MLGYKKPPQSPATGHSDIGQGSAISMQFKAPIRMLIGIGIAMNLFAARRRVGQQIDRVYRVKRG